VRLYYLKTRRRPAGSADIPWLQTLHGAVDGEHGSRIAGHSPFEGLRAVEPCGGVVALLQGGPHRGTPCRETPKSSPVEHAAIDRGRALRTHRAGADRSCRRVQADDLQGPHRLQEAGFPLVDETRDNRTYWKLDAHPFRHLTQLGFSLSELCALYLSRRLVESLTGIPFQAALGGAFGKFEREIKPKMKAYLDCLPSVMSARPTAEKWPFRPRTTA